MAEVHTFKLDPATLRWDRLTNLLEEQLRSGVDLGPRGVQMAALSRGIERDVCEALAQVEQASASLSPDNPARRQLEPALETLRQMILSLQAQARSVSEVSCRLTVETATL